MYVHSIHSWHLAVGQVMLLTSYLIPHTSISIHTCVHVALTTGVFWLAGMGFYH